MAKKVQELPKTEPVKLTVAQVFTLFPIGGAPGPLTRLYQQQFKPSIGMRLLTMTESVQKVAERAYKLRTDIFEKYGEKKDDGSISVAAPGQDGHDPEKWEAFTNELIELDKIELDFPGFDRTLKLVDIAEKSNLTLTLADLAALKPLFQE